MSTVTSADLQSLWAEAVARDAAIDAALPDEAACLSVMFSAYQRLKRLGWREAMYCKKDGSIFDAIECGSTGIHECIYEGEWPTGRYWVLAAGDSWPSRPVLVRDKPGADS